MAKDRGESLSLIITAHETRNTATKLPPVVDITLTNPPITMASSEQNITLRVLVAGTGMTFRISLPPSELT